MREPKGVVSPLSVPRRLIADLLHFANRVPSIPLSRLMDVSALFAARRAHPARPSWSVIFMKAYARVAMEHPPLRRALLEWPLMRIYEHPQTNCSLAIERTFDGEEGVFFGMFRAPEGQTIGELQRSLTEFKTLPLDEIGFFRRMIRISRYPTPIRRFLWSTSLNASGRARAKRFGTFGVTTLGGRGVEQIHPLSPLTTTLTFGPIDSRGKVTVKIIYDHRVLDGAYVARRLVDLEQTLNGAILEELRKGEACEVVLPLSPPTVSSSHPAKIAALRPVHARNAGRRA
jgi:pyruvate/2-oxoglutarate dehydrogenase complex dihydrolipoamide acyltransferase (E2) component